jgi:isoleucyl-tRNA synthetase
VASATEGYEQYLTVNVLRTFEDFLDDLSNWYIRRTRRRFWDGDDAALRTLWATLVQVVRVVAPIMPFLAEALWEILVTDVCEDVPSSVFLAEWPGVGPIDENLLADQAAVRQVVDLGRQARAAAGIKVRQPLGRLLVDGAARVTANADLVREELRVKEVVLGHVDAELKVRPNLPVLGPRMGPQLPALRAALAAGEFELLDDGSIRVGELVLSPDEVLVERSGMEGWSVASGDGVTVALDMALDEELRLEGRVYDLIHHVNRLRKETGLEITDRIHLTLPAGDADLSPHRDWIMRETLAVTLETGPGDEVALELASV